MSEKHTEAEAMMVLPDPEPERQMTIAAPGSVQEIQAMVRRAEIMAESLDKLRAYAVARTLKSDWVEMGGKVYLEGDGGLRMAPVIGLEVLNPKKSIEVLEDGVVRVTYKADIISKLFGVRFDGVERTRRTDDQFLKRNQARADLEDVESACYKGLVARGCQLVAGLSGLTPEELEMRYSLKVGSKVEYKTGLKDAQKADAAAAPDDRLEIARLLLELNNGDKQMAEKMLVQITENKEKGWAGKRRPEDLTEKGVAFVLRKLQEMAAKTQ